MKVGRWKNGGPTDLIITTKSLPVYNFHPIITTREREQHNSQFVEIEKVFVQYILLVGWCTKLLAQDVRLLSYLLVYFIVSDFFSERCLYVSRFYPKSHLNYFVLSKLFCRINCLFKFIILKKLFLFFDIFTYSSFQTLPLVLVLLAGSGLRWAMSPFLSLLFTITAPLLKSLK